MSNFKITSPKGFHITFDNGYTISVQFGPGNYCDNYNRRIGQEDEACGKEGSSTAETAYWGRDGNFVEDEGDDVQGYQTVAQVMERMIKVASLPNDKTHLKTASPETDTKTQTDITPKPTATS